MQTTRISDAQIEALRQEAAGAGDNPTVHCCFVATGEREPGSGGQQWPASLTEARQACADMIAEGAESR